jgi:hypothetical protein
MKKNWLFLSVFALLMCGCAIEENKENTKNEDTEESKKENEEEKDVPRNKRKPSHVIEVINPDKAKMDYWQTIKQAFDFINDVTVDLECVFNSLQMPMLKSVDLSTIYGFVDLKNKINELKLVKTAKTIAKPISPIIKILKFLNPVKWLAMLITAIFTASLTRDLIFAFAEIVAWEFSQFYAKCKDENASLIV